MHLFKYIYMQMNIYIYIFDYFLTKKDYVKNVKFIG